MINGRELTKNGYLYVYLSNETPNQDVYFDNLKVTRQGVVTSHSLCAQNWIRTYEVIDFGLSSGKIYDVS